LPQLGISVDNIIGYFRALLGKNIRRGTNGHSPIAYQDRDLGSRRATIGGKKSFAKSRIRCLNVDLNSPWWRSRNMVE
jgi:hypothetical protein